MKSADTSPHEIICQELHQSIKSFEERKGDRGREGIFSPEKFLPFPRGHKTTSTGKEGLRLFNIGFAELLLVLVVAYVIVGPKDLPKVARWLGRMVRRARQLVKEVKDEVGWDEMMNETEDVRKDINATLKEADITADFKDAQKELRKSLREAEKDTMKK